MSRTRRGAPGSGRSAASAPERRNPSARRGDRRVAGLVGVALVVGLGLAGGWWWWSGASAKRSGAIPVGRAPSGAEVTTELAALAAQDWAGVDPDTAAVVRALVDAVRREPASGANWGRLGAVLKSCHLTDLASRSLGMAERLDPTNPRWPYHLATLEGERAPAAEASLAALHRAAALAGTRPEMPRLRLARLLMEQGRSDEARREAETVLAANPDCAPARMVLAQLKQAGGDWAGAMALAEACRRHPSTARAAAILLAAGRRRLGDLPAAEAAAREASALPPDAGWPDPFEEEALSWRGDPRNLSDRAQAHLLAGRPEAAQPLIDRLVREHPGFGEGWLLLGRAQYLQRQPAAAEASLRRHLQLDGRSVNGHFQLGMVLLAQQNFAAAAESFRAALALKPEFGPAHFNLGFALARLGRVREAMEPFRQAIRHNPEKIDSYILLADLHLQAGEIDQAAQLAALAERVDPADRRLPSLRRKVGLERP